MMPGFIKVDSDRFYAGIWDDIKKTCMTAHMQRDGAKSKDDYPVVAQSNWKEVRECKKAGILAPTLLIYWGYTETDKGKTVLAVTRNDGANGDEHWVAPQLA